jgi:hypothetical protein
VPFRRRGHRLSPSGRQLHTFGISRESGLSAIRD